MSATDRLRKPVDNTTPKTPFFGRTPKTSFGHIKSLPWRNYSDDVVLVVERRGAISVVSLGLMSCSCHCTCHKMGLISGTYMGSNEKRPLTQA